VPPGKIVLVPHDHFGIDLSPGLSIKLNTALASDVLAIDGIEGNFLKLVRQEFGGQVSAHVRCDISSGAVINIRPGAFKPVPNVAAAGMVIDKSSEVGDLTARRRYLETIVAEAGDVDITKHNLLVSIGRGIQEKDNVALAEELAEVLGAAVSCSRPVVDAKWRVGCSSRRLSRLSHRHRVAFRSAIGIRPRRRTGFMVGRNALSAVLEKSCARRQRRQRQSAGRGPGELVGL
jgi:electron transfer flavoprotein alpha subunit